MTYSQKISRKTRIKGPSHGRLRQELGKASAAHEFERFKKEDAKAVKPARANEDKINRLRNRLKILRMGVLEVMPAEGVKNVIENAIEFHTGVSAFGALFLAKKEGRIILPNDVHDRILEDERITYLEQYYPVWTGTVVIYEASDKKFEKRVVFEYDEGNFISFDVPTCFRGKKNCALVVEHPDFDMIPLGARGHALKASELAKIHLIENFPRIEPNAWYDYEDRFRIPVGDVRFFRREDYWGPTRQLCRQYDSFVGLVVRGYGFHHDAGRKCVDICHSPSGHLGVALI